MPPYKEKKDCDPTHLRVTFHNFINRFRFPQAPTKARKMKTDQLNVLLDHRVHDFPLFTGVFYKARDTLSTKTFVQNDDAMESCESLYWIVKCTFLPFAISRFMSKLGLLKFFNSHFIPIEVLGLVKIPAII